MQLFNINFLRIKRRVVKDSNVVQIHKHIQRRNLFTIPFESKLKNSMIVKLFIFLSLCWGAASDLSSEVLFQNKVRLYQHSYCKLHIEDEIGFLKTFPKEYSSGCIMYVNEVCTALYILWKHLINSYFWKNK